MILQAAPSAYSRDDQDRIRALIAQAFDRCLKAGRDIEMGDARVILSSPDGSRWALSVDNAGALSAVAA